MCNLVGLWQRLVEVARLPAEGQRQVASMGSTKRVLSRRPDLDPEARALLFEGVTRWSAADQAWPSPAS